MTEGQEEEGIYRHIKWGGAGMLLLLGQVRAVDYQGFSDRRSNGVIKVKHRRWRYGNTPLERAIT